MLCIPIKASSVKKALPLIEKALAFNTLIELRLDYFSTDDFASLHHLPKTRPFIFTLRKKSEGGHYKKTEEERQQSLLYLATLKPAYLDLEASLPKEFIAHLSLKHPEIKLILSHHNLNNMPQDLSQLLKQMKHPAAHFYKIALHASHLSETLRFMDWAREQPPNIIPIALGPHGTLSRFISPLTYAPLSLQQKTAPGQLPLSYFIRKNHNTRLLGLIGYPTKKSISDQTHNLLLQQREINALYTKIDVTPEELPYFLQKARHLPLQGLSVTMPLKEIILPHLDQIDPEAHNIGAVNTLLFKEGKIIGFNTDGKGALNALEKTTPVFNKKIALLGSGGSAKAIHYEATKRGAKTTIFSRHPEKSPTLKPLKDLSKENYDILINCTPLPLPTKNIHPETIVMDINTSTHLTPLLQKALQKNCLIVQGHEMFIEQALYQFQIWFQEDITLLRPLLTQIVLDNLSSHMPFSGAKKEA